MSPLGLYVWGAVTFFIIALGWCGAGAGGQGSQYPVAIVVALFTAALWPLCFAACILYFPYWLGGKLVS